MKKTLLIIAFIVLPALTSYSQDYMKKIAEKACTCVSEIPDEEELTGENFGLCILEIAAQYSDELLRDHNIDMLNIDVQGEELGRKVALEMMTTCPDQIRRIAASTAQEKEEVEDAYLEAEGLIKSIVDDSFVVFSLTDNEGRTSKFYWLTFIKSENDIQNDFENLEGKFVKIEYSTVEIYDPKIREYRNYNMIESLNITQ